MNAEAQENRNKIQMNDTKQTVKESAIRAEVRYSTQELVDALLAANTKNRPIRKSNIDTICEEIKSGRWCVTNQGIGVCEDGSLVDGQHRLLAIRKMGYPRLPILVVTGLSESARIAVDQHSRRTARDVIMFAFNTRVSRIAPPVARAISMHRNNWTRRTVCISDLMDIISEYEDEISEVVNRKGLEDFFNAQTFAAAVYLAKQTGRSEDVAAILERVKDGQLLTKTMPEFHLRNYIIQTRGTSGGGTRAQEAFEKSMKAISYALDGKQMGVLRVGGAE